jgi:two-component system OmpR family sensor kinase
MTRTAPPRPRIRRRLTLWYAISIFGLLLIAMFAMRTWSRRALMAQEVEATDRAVGLVHSFFSAEFDEFGEIRETITHITGQLVFAEVLVEFLEPDGTVFGRTMTMNQSPPTPPTFEVVRVLNTQKAPGWSLRLQMSNAARLRAEARIDRDILIGLPIAIVIATLAAWLATGRALRPVGDMALATEEIARGDGDRRLPVADPLDEFGRLGRQFNDLLDQRDSTLAQQRQFLTDAAHELRTPIARMLSTVELQLTSASGEPGTDRSDRTALERVQRDLQNASMLVDELMQIARADAGGGETGLIEAYLDDIVAEAIPTWEAESKRRGVTLRIADLEEARARLDPRLVNRLLGVLVGNALAYTPAGGDVNVSVRRIGGLSQLIVSDTGIGISESEQRKVFDRFYRGTQARGVEPGGSGLGLAIASWIAETHHATIALESAPGKGTTVRVEFPS